MFHQAWMVRRGITLHSIEHCEPWLKDLGGKIPNLAMPQPDGQQTKWFPHYVARNDGKGCDQTLPNDWAIMERIFGTYTRYPREHLLEKYAPQGFDIVSVDGRFRDGCIVQAASLHDPEHPMLLNKEYGLLLLDNAERDVYQKAAKLPSHWLVVSFVNPVSETAIWMACPSKEDEHCTRARVRIAEYMATVPSSVVGRWYKSHMERARRDGVPGA
jgi:hypothetical protein